MDDLDRVIMNQQAVGSNPVNHPNHAGIIHNLGKALEHRFERTASLEDLNYAIVIIEQAVELTPV